MTIGPKWIERWKRLAAAPLSYASDERKPWFIMHAGGWIILFAILAWSAWHFLRDQ